jgi:hypothetical protein
MLHKQTVMLKGNVLDLIETGEDSFVVSVDDVFEAGSTSQLREKPVAGLQSLQRFCKTGDSWSEDSLEFAVEAAKEDVEVHSLSTLLYSLQNLRKRGDEE